MVQVAHKIVAVGLGQNAGGGNGSINGVALDDAFMPDPFVFIEAVAVDEQKLRFLFQFVQGQVHGFKRSVKNIDAVDLFMIHHGHAVADRVFFNECAQDVAVFFRYLFRIIEQGVKKAFG